MRVERYASYGALILLAAAIGSACGQSFESAGDAPDASAGTSGSAGGGTGGKGAAGGKGGSSSGGAAGNGSTGGGAGTGGSSGSTGASGGASGTGVDAGTDARPPPEQDCAPDSGSSQGTAADPERRELTRGVNGEFVDTCDADGNLIEYFCEVKVICDDPPNPSCVAYKTGKVTSELFDCSGNCANGECSARCPATGDVLIYESIQADGAARFKAADFARHYECTLIFDNPGDSYDCKTSPVVGDEVVVASLGLGTQHCTGGEIGNIGVSFCSYACRIAS